MLFSNCASLFTSTTYDVTFQTNPSDAKIVITDMKKGYEVFIGTTPAIVPLKSSAGFFSKAEYLISLSFPGYKEHVMTLTADIDGWYFGNILIGGFLGMLIIDPATGAMWKIDRKLVNIQLTPENNTNYQSLQILSIDEVPEEMKEHLVSIN
ncbi:hypothetical protein LJB84_01615 [Bacteroidales bacterium OttesenSCG-928-J19]|nr:hypothetical protein [Bacteroidales bacterium OttesenSCG-928-J19]